MSHYGDAIYKLRRIYDIDGPWWFAGACVLLLAVDVAVWLGSFWLAARIFDVL